MRAYSPRYTLHYTVSWCILKPVWKFSVESRAESDSSYVQSMIREDSNENGQRTISNIKPEEGTHRTGSISVKFDKKCVTPHATRQHPPQGLQSEGDQTWLQSQSDLVNICLRFQQIILRFVFNPWRDRDRAPLSVSISNCETDAFSLMGWDWRNQATKYNIISSVVEI